VKKKHSVQGLGLRKKDKPNLEIRNSGHKGKSPTNPTSKGKKQQVSERILRDRVRKDDPQRQLSC
jgi:hypothetical protein